MQAHTPPPLAAMFPVDPTSAQAVAESSSETDAFGLQTMVSPSSAFAALSTPAVETVAKSAVEKSRQSMTIAIPPVSNLQPAVCSPGRTARTPSMGGSRFTSGFGNGLLVALDQSAGGRVDVVVPQKPSRAVGDGTPGPIIGIAPPSTENRPLNMWEQTQPDKMQSLAQVALAGLRDKKGRAYFEVMRTMATCALVSFAVAVFGFVLQNEVYYLEVTTKYGDCVSWDMAPTWAQVFIIGGQSITSLATIVNVYAVCTYHYYSKLRNDLEYSEFTPVPFYKSANFMVMVIEVLVCIVHCPPTVYGCFDVLMFSAEATYAQYSYQMINLFMIVRFYLLVRFQRFNNRFTTPQGKVVLGLYNREGGAMLSVKDVLDQNPITYLISLYMAGLIVFAYVFMCTERPAGELDSIRWAPVTYGQCLWFVWTVVSTVGFGDFVPVTLFGRGTTFLVGVFGLVVSALLVSIAYSELQLTHEERQISRSMAWLFAKKEQEMQAALFIMRWYRLTRHKLAARDGTKETPGIGMDKYSMEQAYIRSIKSWRALKKRMQQIRYTLDVPNSSGELYPFVQDIGRACESIHEYLMPPEQNGDQPDPKHRPFTAGPVTGGIPRPATPQNDHTLLELLAMMKQMSTEICCLRSNQETILDHLSVSKDSNDRVNQVHGKGNTSVAPSRPWSLTAGVDGDSGRREVGSDVGAVRESDAPTGPTTPSRVIDVDVSAQLGAYHAQHQVHVVAPSLLDSSRTRDVPAPTRRHAGIREGSDIVVL